MEEVEKLIKEGKYKDALNLVKGQEDSPIKFYYLALIYFKSGKLKEALRFAEKAKRTGSEPRFSTLYAYILYSLGYERQDVELLEKALKEMQKALMTNKQLENDYEFLYYMANTLYELEKYNEALDAVNKALAIKEDESLHKLKGDILFKLGKYEDAIKEYEKSIEKDENLYAIGFTYYKMGEYKKALEYLDKAIAINPENPYYYETKAEVLLELEKKDEAMKEINKALEIDPENPYLVSIEVEILSHLDQKKALKIAQDYIKYFEEYRDIFCEDIKDKKVKDDVKKEIEILCP
ncbi:tetratricopeptide repeat protein [Stygiolobus azoricus]|uniref:Tetratricopeptide repeat protein n=1 Tax=Stygiolobus azoricus TaxID=41675 RepID=A0A650CKZ0_9CREN|nr:tetratricopeptide repeat protein [Stygiolobus azoricus]QGR18541.1 tetratricopeptide repeat protein [Stygiolobus azoricus]